MKLIKKIEERIIYTSSIAFLTFISLIAQINIILFISNIFIYMNLYKAFYI